MTGQSSEAAVNSDEALNVAAAEATKAGEEVKTEEEKLAIKQAEHEVEVEAAKQAEIEAEEAKKQAELEGLPTDHGERSDLGRKIWAFHRRQDETDNRIDRMLNLFEAQAKPKETEMELDPNETVTFAEMQQFMAKEKEKESQQKTDYDQKYVASISEQASGLEEVEYNAILDEMQNVTYTPSKNPARDAERNFDKAEKIYLRKRLAGKKGEKINPVMGKEPRSALGGIVNQKVVTKDTTLPKLDAHGQSYLAFVAREDGNEKATDLHKSLSKED